MDRLHGGAEPGGRPEGRCGAELSEHQGYGDLRPPLEVRRRTLTAAAQPGAGGAARLDRGGFCLSPPRRPDLRGQPPRVTDAAVKKKYEKQPPNRAAAFQTVDKPLLSQPGPARGIVKGDGESPFTFNLCKNGNFFERSHFCVSSCRHFVDSLKTHSPVWGCAFFVCTVFRRWRSRCVRIP